MAVSKEKVAKAPSAVKAPAAPKKAVAKASPAKAAAKTTTPKKAASPKKATAKKITPEQHYTMVAEAAYYIAEKNGFAGDPQEFWVEAEAQISALLSK